MDCLRRLASDGVAERADERLRRVADRASLLGEVLRVVELGPARLGNTGGRFLRDETGSGAGGCERSLGVEHALEPRAVRDGLAELGWHEDGCERRHTAKYVVCPAPWSRMSNRSAPSSGRATSVARSSSDSSDSTASSAFAFSSSGK